jgi:hypothetical protein
MLKLIATDKYMISVKEQKSGGKLIRIIKI